MTAADDPTDDRPVGSPDESRSGARDWVLHVDLDQFIAAVEIRRRPELRGRPVVVGGDGDPARRRQVVATASYEARAFGVRSGMPLSVAWRRCQEAVFLATDHAAYDAASAEVMAVLRRLPVVLEERGWDEAFLGWRGDDPAPLAARVRTAVLAGTGLTCCVGIGQTRLQAKLATGFAKPVRTGDGYVPGPGVARLTFADWRAVMGPRPVSDLWGVGPRMTANLAALGVHTVGDLADVDGQVLADRFGPRMGPYYQQLGRGGDRSPVSAEPWVRRGLSHERTYEQDLVTPADVAREVTNLACEVVAEVVAQQRVVARVAVKLRTASFFTATRIRTLPEPTTDREVVTTAALTLLDRFEAGRPIRLVGVRVELTDP